MIQVSFAFRRFGIRCAPLRSDRAVMDLILAKVVAEPRLHQNSISVVISTAVHRHRTVTTFDVFSESPSGISEIEVTRSIVWPRPEANSDSDLYIYEPIPIPVIKSFLRWLR